MKQFTIVIRVEPKRPTVPEYTASSCVEYAMNTACTELEGYGFDTSYSMEEC